MNINEKVHRINRLADKMVKEYSHLDIPNLLDHLIKYLESLGINVPVSPIFNKFNTPREYIEGRISFDRVVFGYGWGKTEKKAVSKCMFLNISAHKLGLDFKNEGLLFTDIEDDGVNENRPMIRIADMLDDKKNWHHYFNNLKYEIKNNETKV